MSDHRKNKRYACTVPVDGKNRSAFDDTQTVDFSKSGLGFISKHRIPLNKEIPIELELTAEGEPVFVIGRVQWVQRILNSQNYRVGLVFKDVVKGSKTRLNQYFKEHNVG